MLPQISVVVEDKNWALLRAEKNQPASGIVVDVESGLVDIGAIQRFIRAEQSNKLHACLGIPHQDLIVRAFVVPQMNPFELSKAIAFEIKKYIPFNIVEAYYSTLIFPFVDHQNKMMRVLFYAVRKSTVEKYKGQLAQVGINVTRCEPAICGLVRAMILRKDIKATDKLALLDIRKQKGIIYFIDAGVVKFVREVPLSSAIDPMSQGTGDLNDVKGRFLNEIHNSFDYYFRQFGERLTDMLVVSNDDWFNSVEEFMTSVKIKSRKYSFEVTLGVRKINEFSMACSLGLGLTGNMFAPSVDLLIPPKIAKKDMLSDIGLSPKEFESVLNLIVILIVFLVGGFGFLWFKQDALKKQLTQVIAAQNEFSSTPADNIQTLISSAQKDIKGLGLAPSKSDQYLILVLIVKNMPSGVWLQDVSLGYNNQSQALSVALRAAVYLPDVSQQARVVNEFQFNLKNDKTLAQHITRWQLKAMSRLLIKNRMSTVFDLSSG